MDYDIRKAIRDDNPVVAANELYRKGEYKTLANLIIQHKFNPLNYYREEILNIEVIKYSTFIVQKITTTAGIVLYITYKKLTPKGVLKNITPKQKATLQKKIETARTTIYDLDTTGELDLREQLYAFSAESINNLSDLQHQERTKLYKRRIKEIVMDTIDYKYDGAIMDPDYFKITDFCTVEVITPKNRKEKRKYLPIRGILQHLNLLQMSPHETDSYQIANRYFMGTL